MSVEAKLNTQVVKLMNKLWSTQFGYQTKDVLNVLPYSIRSNVLWTVSYGVIENISFFSPANKVNYNIN